MKKLNRFEELFLKQILTTELERNEKWLEENKGKVEAYFVENEGIPMLKNLLSKIEV